MNIESYPIEIDKSLVLRYLGYEDKNVSKKILSEIDEAIKESYKIIDPKIVFDRIHIKYDEEDKRIILKDGSIFKEEYVVRNLKDADYIVVAISTLGRAIDEKIKELFNQGDYLKGMIYDTIANAALEHLNKCLWQDLMKDAKSKGLGITHKLSPGDSRWTIEDQKIIFKILAGNVIGVTLNDSYMMDPIKSNSLVYGIGENIKTSLVAHDCDECLLIDCIYRNTSKDHFYNVIIEYGGKEKVIKVEKGANLFKVLIENEIDVPNICGGSQICGKCKVIVDTNEEISKFERIFLTDREIRNGTRLACYVKIDKNLKVIVPHLESKATILTENAAVQIKNKKSRVLTKKIKLNKPSLKDQRDDYTRIEESLGVKIKMSLDLLRNLPEVLNECDYHVLVFTHKDEIIDIRSDDANDKVYGIAIDIGTTTIASYLYDLKTFEKIDVYSSLNPQKVFGLDVISRINYTINEKNGLKKMNKVLIDEINNHIEAFCKKNNILNENIYEMILVGNTTMVHLAVKESVKKIANAPFIPAFTASLELKAKELNINIHPEGYIITLPMVSSYIGADTIGAILASRMYEKEEISLLIDIGTNGEIVLGNKDKLVACSAAAGPAFEGVGITCGMGGIEGAIDHVDFTKEPIYTTIGNKTAQGICGSGIVDVISELVKSGIIDKTGRMVDRNEISSQTNQVLVGRIKKYKNEKIFLIDEKEDIYITQKDIRQIQLAKGAILAGIKVLLKECGLEVTDVKTLYLAGGFGSYINVDSAVTINLIPKELKDKVLQIGNAAGEGAILSLLSDEELTIAKCIKKKVKYIELSNFTSFQEEFVNSLYL